MIRPSANLDSSSYEFAYDILRALAPELPSKVVFDIGAGDERMRRVEELGFEWHGFDLRPRKEATPWDLNDPCPSNLTPGAVMLLDVIEHCLNPGVALRNIAAVLPAGARIVVTVPNPGWSRSRIDILLKGVPSCFTQSDLDDNHHVFTPWPHILEKMLRDVGLVVEKYVTLDGRTRVFRRPVSITYPIRCLASLANVAIEAADPSSCGMSFGFVARKIALA